DAGDHLATPERRDDIGVGACRLDDVDVALGDHNAAVTGVVRAHVRYRLGSYAEHHLFAVIGGEPRRPAVHGKHDRIAAGPRQLHGGTVAVGLDRDRYEVH